MLWRKAVLQLILYILNQRRKCKESYIKSTGGTLRKQEKAKQGKVKGWIKSTMETYSFYTDGYRMVLVHIVCRQQNNNEF